MTPDIEARKAWISVLAKASPERLAALMPDLPPHQVMRQPEVGAVMVRGRVGATGAAFNLGEMTVTRCSIRLEDGPVGHAWVQGRNPAHALRAAVADALLQTDAAPRYSQAVLQPLMNEAATAKSDRMQKAAATKVEFFTMVRGEDQ